MDESADIFCLWPFSVIECLLFCRLGCEMRKWSFISTLKFSCCSNKDRLGFSRFAHLAGKICLNVLKWYYESNFYPLIFWAYHIEFHERMKNAVYRLQISALVPEICKFEKWVKYANEMTDDVIHSTQYYIKHINGAILANLQYRTLKLGRLIVLQETHLWP